MRIWQGQLSRHVYMTAIGTHETSKNRQEDAKTSSVFSWFSLEVKANLEGQRLSSWSWHSALWYLFAFITINISLSLPTIVMYKVKFRTARVNFKTKVDCHKDFVAHHFVRGVYICVYISTCMSCILIGFICILRQWLWYKFFKTVTFEVFRFVV